MLVQCITVKFYKLHTHLARIIAVQTCTKEKQTVNRQKHTRKKEEKEELVGIYCHAYQLMVTGQGLVALFSCFLFFIFIGIQLLYDLVQTASKLTIVSAKEAIKTPQTTDKILHQIKLKKN